MCVCENILNVIRKGGGAAMQPLATITVVTCLVCYRT